METGNVNYDVMIKSSRKAIEYGCVFTKQIPFYGVADHSVAKVAAIVGVKNAS